MEDNEGIEMLGTEVRFRCDGTNKEFDRVTIGYVVCCRTKKETGDVSLDILIKGCPRSVTVPIERVLGQWGEGCGL